MQYHKVTKKEKVEKVVNVLNDSIEQYGYFDVYLKDMSVIWGKKFELNYVGKEPYILIMDINNKAYANIKLKSIKQIGAITFSI